jgi:death on curing protein
MSSSGKLTKRPAKSTLGCSVVWLNSNVRRSRLEQEPVFLTRDHIDATHQDQIKSFGGLHGIRSEESLESAIAQPVNVYNYGDGDLYEIAAAYAFHTAESQAYFDGNKRTGVQAAADFLEINGVDTSSLPEMATSDALIRVAKHELDRLGLTAFFRDSLRPK